MYQITDIELLWIGVHLFMLIEVAFVDFSVPLQLVYGLATSMPQIIMKGLDNFSLFLNHL